MNIIFFILQADPLSAVSYLYCIIIVVSYVVSIFNCVDIVT